MIALFTTPLGVHAWGPEGHSMIGDMAQTYLKPKALAAVQTLLNGTSLGDNANWADTVKRSDPWKWSSNLHFIDIIDRPPEECIFNEDRDCPKGDCINTAIGNFTNRACSANVDDAAVAVKFLTHFLGDITQPLHNSNYTLGGNQINVTFNGTNYNLHKIWDIDMPAARMNQFGGRAGYQKYLLDRINTGDFAALKKDWISKQPYNAVSKYGNSLASIDYTIDAATFDCSYVYKTFTTTPPYDLSGDYTTQSFPILDLQFAKAAVRLADLLNSIFDNCGSAPSTTTVATATATTTEPCETITVTPTVTVYPSSTATTVATTVATTEPCETITVVPSQTPTVTSVVTSVATTVLTSSGVSVTQTVVYTVPSASTTGGYTSVAATVSTPASTVAQSTAPVYTSVAQSTSVAATVSVPVYTVPTEVPTVSPTASVPVYSTEVPTEAPTDVPSETSTPCDEPTDVPTQAPTAVPTYPSGEPTDLPTAAPTDAPAPTETAGGYGNDKPIISSAKETGFSLLAALALFAF